VSGDEDGRAFWWSLGRVMGVESNDVVRMLGSYPDEDKPKRPFTLFAALPLPLGDKHPTDYLHLSALLTPTKLVIVAMKPSPKTWYREIRTGADGAIGCASWLSSGQVEQESDPVLAFSWGASVNFLRVRATSHPKEMPTPGFVKGRKWEAPSAVRALQWYDANVSRLFNTADPSMCSFSRRTRSSFSTYDRCKWLNAHL
jgi:hypothetical protein